MGTPSTSELLFRHERTDIALHDSVSWNVCPVVTAIVTLSADDVTVTV
jgi:hypothetical protein